MKESGCRRGEKNAGTEKPNSFAIPEAEETAGEIGQVNDGVKASGATVAGIGVAGGVEGGDAVADPVLVIGDFRGGHLRVDSDAASGDGIERSSPMA